MDGVMLGMVAAAVAAPCFTFLTYWLGGKERLKRLELEELHSKGKADLVELQETKNRLSILEKQVNSLREQIEDCEAHRHELRLAIIKAGIKL